jgi:hypothetical protein
MHGASCPGRVRGPEARKEKALERQKLKRGSAIDAGQLGSVRTDSQKEEGFEVGVAGGVDVLRLSNPEQPGSALRHAERELIVVGGVRQLRVSVGVEETGGDKVRVMSSAMLVANHKGAGSLERGV